MRFWDHVRAALIVLHVGVLTLAAAQEELGLRTVLRPFKPYIAATGLRQSWQMFGTVPEAGGILEIEGRTDAGWEPLFVDHSPHQWLARTLNHGRVRTQRSLYAHARFQRRYREMARWLGRRALADHPHVHAVRIRFQGVRTPPIDAFVGERVATGPFWEEIVERAP